MENSEEIVSSQNLFLFEKDCSSLKKRVVLSGKNLTIPEMISIARGDAIVEITDDPKILEKINECYERMMNDVKNGVPIYGCNSGYGAQASRVLNSGSEEERVSIAKKISESITHVDVSVGPVFTKDIVRLAMAIRINMLLQGVSAVKLSDLNTLKDMLNAQITPIVNQYGGIGASGDLAHNCRVLNAARGMHGVKVMDRDGRTLDALEALQNANIAPLVLDPKAGLGLVNGDNFSTAVAALLAYDTLHTFIVSIVAGAMTIQVLKGSDRSFHPLISGVRPHVGQVEVAKIMRFLLSDTKLSYQEMKGHILREQGIKIQDGYSLRGFSQFHGVNYEKLQWIFKVITKNANSVSDNPLWVSPEFATDEEEPWQWVSGGNFLAMYMVEVIDAARKTLTQIVKLSDRHLSRLVNIHENNGLPPNLSDDQAISGCAFKGIQIQSGMLEVYSALLSIPVSTFFGVHEEGNQDITAHSLTSGILGMENLRLCRYALAQHLLALAQGVDIRGGEELLSPSTQAVYKFIRNMTEYVSIERPLNNDIEKIYQSIVDGSMMENIRTDVLNNFI